MENYKQNKSTSPKDGMKKIVIGIISLIIIVAVVFGIIWLQQTGDEINVIGKVSDINMEGKNINVQQVQITEERFGRYERNEQLFAVIWDENTEFIIEGIEGENLNAQNEIFSPEATVEIEASEQITGNSVLAKSIRLIERSPFRE